MSTHSHTKEYRELQVQFHRMWTAVGIAHDRGEPFPYVKRDWKDLDSAIHDAIKAGVRS